MRGNAGPIRSCTLLVVVLTLFVTGRAIGQQPRTPLATKTRIVLLGTGGRRTARRSYTDIVLRRKSSTSP